MMIDKSVRLANFTIDTLVIVVILLGISMGCYFLYPEILMRENIILEIIVSAVYFFYYFIFEFTTGKTIGKLLTKTVVVDRNGNKPGIGKILGRTIVRFIPLDEFSFLFSFEGMHDSFSKTTLAFSSRKVSKTE